MRYRIKPKTTAMLSVTIAILSLFFAMTVWAASGTTDSSAVPGATNSYTLADIYNRLNAGTAGSQSTFTEPLAGPGTGTMNDLNGIMSLAPALDDTNGAGVADVASGKQFWGLTSGGWGLQTGTASLGSTYNVAVPKTGQTTVVTAGDDGDLQKGVVWPVPRFTANGDNNNDGDCIDGGETCDGTVTDNLTGLIWLTNANCAAATRPWGTALSDVASLNSVGTINGKPCGDSSNAASHQTDWRLPNVLELQSLIHSGFSNPALSNAAGTAQWAPGDPFTGVQSSYYWSGTSHAISPALAWRVDLNGRLVHSNKGDVSYVWPVRGGQ